MLKPKLRKDRRYEIRFSIRSVRHFKILGKKGQSYQDAKKVAEEFYLSFQTPQATLNLKPTLSDVFRIYLEVKENRISDRSLFNAKSYLKNKFIPFFGDKPVEDITPIELERYQNYRLSQKAEGSTINRELSVLIAAVNRSYKKREIKTNPFTGGAVEKLEENKKDEFFELNEWNKFINTLSNMDSHVRMSIDVFKALLLTGSTINGFVLYIIRWPLTASSSIPKNIFLPLICPVGINYGSNYL